MPLYRFHDLIIESNVAFSELPSAEAEVPTCVFQLLQAEEHNGISPRWHFHWRRPDAKPWLSFGTLSPGYLLRFPDFADFIVSSDGKEIRCYPDSGASRDVIGHLFLNQVVPRILNHWGRVVLHGSAVVSRLGAVAFLGETGWGKSTLAASFSVERFPLLTDDGFVIKDDAGTLCAIPSRSGLRLWPDTLREVFREEPPSAQASDNTRKTNVAFDDLRLTQGELPVPISAIYVLPPAEGPTDSVEIRVDPLSSREAFLELVKYLYRLHVNDRQRSKIEFRKLGRVANEIPLSRLHFPRRFSALPLVREAVLNHLSDAQ